MSRHLVLTGMILALAGTAFGQTPAAVKVVGFASGEDVMVELGSVFRALGCDVTWNPDTDEVSLVTEGARLVLVPGQAPWKRLTEGEETTQGSWLTPPRYVGFKLHAPLMATCAAAGLACETDPGAAEYNVGGTPVKLRLVTEPEKIALDLSSGSLVKLVTEKGDIYLDLFDEKTPVTVGSFLDLVTKGFYDGLTFHRVLADFMIQGGDPLGNGHGGPGFTIPDEADKGLRHYRGSLSMAKTPEPDTGGSQFFICHVPCDHLDGIHTVFGRCVLGMDVVDRIVAGDKILKATVVNQSAHAERAIMAALLARVQEQ